MDQETQAIIDTQRRLQAAWGERVRDLGRIVGFGNMMDLARQCWREELEDKGYFVGGEFAVGPCVAMTERCICGGKGNCDWCCGCGWLTKHVKRLAEKRRQPKSRKGRG